jgi:hypothetical protein
MDSNAPETLVLSACEIIAWNLKRARRSHGWTQDEAAKQLEPYLGYRLTRAAFSQAERCMFGKLRRFDADEIVAFSRALDVPIASLFVPPPQPFLGKQVMVNGKSGNPKARITSPPLSRQQMLLLAQRSRDAPNKPVRRGRPAYTPPALEQVEAAAERARDMAEIATFLKVHPATFYRKKRDSPEFNRAVERGREKRAGAAAIARYETDASVSRRKLDKKSTMLFYLKTYPFWRYGNKFQAAPNPDTPAGRDSRAEDLKLIQAMTAEERQRMEAICESARQRLIAPQVMATSDAAGLGEEMERRETPVAGGSDITSPNHRPIAPHSVQESHGGNSAVRGTPFLPSQDKRRGDPASRDDYWRCSKCHRHVTPEQGPIRWGGVIVEHQDCPYLGVPGPRSA